jgi:hypothetical protein
MKGRTSLLVALAWVLTAGHALAQDKYTIKLKELGNGDSSHVDRKEAMTTKSAVRLPNEPAPKTFEVKAAKYYSYTDKVLERPKGSSVPTKVKRVYEKPVVEAPVETGAKGGFSYEQSFTPKILIEKKGTHYEFCFEGGEVLKKGTNDLNAPDVFQSDSSIIAEALHKATNDLYNDLNDEFNKREQDKQTKALLPPGPVAVNETWKMINSKEFLPEYGNNGDSIQDFKSEGTAKLVKVYKKDARLYGVIDAVFDFQFKAVIKKDAAAIAPPAIDVKGTVKLTFDACIDGTFVEQSFNAKMEMQVGTATTKTGSKDYKVKELRSK